MLKEMERELKCLINKEDYEKMLKSYDFQKSKEQRNVYFDTPDQLIKSKKGAMRLRFVNEKIIFTLKIKSDAITHIELEKEVENKDINEIKDPQIVSWLKQYDIQGPFDQITAFTTIRKTYDFEHGQLCLDETHFKNHTDYEVEYEYFDDHDGIHFFNEILKTINRTYTKNCPSKIARAMND